MKIYLASKSPRRKDLLHQMGVEFEVLLLDIPEEIAVGEGVAEYSKRITREKLIASWNKVINEQLAILPVLCADTEVAIGDFVLGKPKDYQDAFAMLKSYSGRSHKVITSIGLKYYDFEKVVTNLTTVHFAVIPDAEIHKYLATGDFKDKSGSYGIQSYIGQYISGIEGCFYSVMGLPLNSVRELLAELESSPVIPLKYLVEE